MEQSKQQKIHWWQVVRGNVLMLGLVSFFTDASSEMIYPLLPIYFTGLVPAGTVAIYVGLMDGIAESVSSLLKIYSGRLSDALGKRKSLAVAGYGISSISRPLMALAAVGWHVVFLRFCDRVGKGIRTSPRDALLSDSADPKARGLAFSFHRAMDHAGAVAGPLIAGVILYAMLGSTFWAGEKTTAGAEEMTALRWLFGLALIPGVAAMIALVGRVKEIAPTGHAVSNDPVKNSSPLSSTPLPRRFYLYLGTVTLFTLGNSSDLFLVFYAREKFDLGLLFVLGLWVTLHLAKIIFSLPGGHFSDRYGRFRAIGIGWGFYVAVYFGMAQVTEQWMIWALLIVYGAYYGMTEGAEKALVADYVPSAQRGRAFGLYHGVVGLAALPASLMFGVFWVELGPERAFTIGAALAFAAMALLVFLGSDQRKS